MSSRKIVSNIVEIGIKQLRSQSEYESITLPIVYNIFLNEDSIFKDVKCEFKKQGYTLSCFPASGWGNPNADADYDLSILE